MVSLPSGPLATSAPGAGLKPSPTARRLHIRLHIRAHGSRRAVRAHASGDPSATISDYMFAPGTLTVHVGDTVTWTNDGPSTHSATANGGSFDTGLLKKGASGSHTFTQAGTFTYFCKVHPFMHGTIVVQASASTPSSNPSSGSGSSGTSGSGAGATTTSTPTSTTGTAQATTTGPTLPATGLDTEGAVLGGIALLGLGLGLRHRSRPRDDGTSA